MCDIEKSNHPLSQILKKNLVQVNDTVADILAISTIAIIVMLVLSKIGFFEFGKTYTYILVVAGALVCLLPKCMVRLFPAEFMKYYMMFSAAVFIGLIGADKNIGVYITYVFVPIMSCLYFDLVFVLETSVFSYLIMVGSVYFVSANMAEVIYQGRDRIHMFLAYVVDANFRWQYKDLVACL